MAHEEKKVISLFMNNKCNLKCKYCYAAYQRDVDSGEIDFDFAKAGIKEYFSKGHHQLRFFGSGEPTISFDLMVKFYEFAYDLIGDRLVTEIQTNGIMSKDKAVWLGKHIDNIWLSWDGPPEINDLCRITISGKGTGKMLENNSTIMMKSKKKGFIGARAVLIPEAIEKQCKIVAYFKSVNIKYVWTSLIRTTERNRNLIKHEDYVTHMCEEFLKAYHYGQDIGVFYGALYMVNFDKKCKYHCRSGLPTPHLTTDGHVSCCDMVPSVTGRTEFELQAVYGKWDKEDRRIIYDQKKIDHIRSRIPKNLSACENCDIAEYCGGGCLGEILPHGKSIFDVLELDCMATKYLAKHFKLGSVHLPVLHP